MPVTPTSNRASSPLIPLGVNATPSANTPATNPAPLPSAVGENQAGPSQHPGAGQGRGIEQRLRIGIEGTTKAQRLAEARKEFKEKKKQWRTARLKDEYGVSTEQERKAISASFINVDGTANTTAYNRHATEQAARNYTDAAGNHPFRNADGSADMTAYKRHATEQAARNYTDAAGNHPFRNADGSGDMAAYKRHATEQAAKNYTDATGNHPFRNADGSADMTAYKRHATEQTARNYTDAAGNHPFRNADGSGDMTAYKKNVSQQRQEDDAVNALLAMSAF